MRILTPQEWEEAWQPLRNAKMSLMEFSRFCDEHKRMLCQKYPGVRFNNARYAVHLAEVAESGQCIPGEFLRSVPAREFSFDLQDLKPLWEAAHAAARAAIAKAKANEVPGEAKNDG